MSFDELEKLRDLVDAAADTLAAELDAGPHTGSKEQWIALENLRAASRQLHSAFAGLYLHAQRYEAWKEEEVPDE